MRKKLVKKVTTMLTIATMIVLCFSVPSKAAELSTPIEETVTSASSVGQLIAGNNGKINGSGSIYVTLGQGNFYADVLAGTAATGVDGSVSCYITTPYGETTYLGLIGADGYHTRTREFAYLRAGNYKFTFYASTNRTIHVYARIYD